MNTSREKLVQRPKKGLPSSKLALEEASFDSAARALAAPKSFRTKVVSSYRAFFIGLLEKWTKLAERNWQTGLVAGRGGVNPKVLR